MASRGKEIRIAYFSHILVKCNADESPGLWEPRVLESRRYDYILRDRSVDHSLDPSLSTLLVGHSCLWGVVSRVALAT